MASVLLLSAVVLATAPAASAEDLKTYEATQASVGCDPDAHVKLALWCEVHGLDAERFEHLAIAVMLQPDNAKARGLMGLVHDGERWSRPEAVVERIKSDEVLSAKLAAYHARREGMPSIANAHWKLAQWCEQQGLKAETLVHVTAVTRLDPSRESAWKYLGFVKHRGRWMRPEQIAVEEAERKAQMAATAQWQPKLVKLRNWLNKATRRNEAERDLADVTDPRAIPAVWLVFGTGQPALQKRAVQILGQIDAPAATRLLAILAVVSPSTDVWRAACETLSHRDPRDALGLLVSFLHDPNPNPETILYRFQWLPIGALGIGSPGITLVEGRHANMLRLYTVDETLGAPAGMFPPPPLPGYIGANPTYVERLATQRSRQVHDLDAVVRGFIAENLMDVGPISTSIREVNTRVIETLRSIASEDLGDNWEAWKRWWIEGLGYVYEPGQFRNPPDLTFFQPKPTFASRFHYSCFAAGTAVRTLTGSHPIELIRPGDQVLAQDTRTGALCFAPILAVYHNPPNETLKIALGERGESVIATPIHRFWKAGRGWIMARDLKVGDVLRAVDGTARVAKVEPAPIQPVFNLEVSANHDFFVGCPAVLVHDNSYIEQVRIPFDMVSLLSTAQ